MPLNTLDQAPLKKALGTLLLSVAISQICPASEDLDSFEKYWSVILFKATQSGFFWFFFFFLSLLD